MRDTCENCRKGSEELHWLGDGWNFWACADCYAAFLDKQIKEQIAKLKTEVAQLEANPTDCSAMEHILHFIEVRVTSLKKLVANRENAR